MNEAAAPTKRRMPGWSWAALFTFDLVALGLAHIFEIIEPPTVWILQAANFLLLIPLASACLRRQERSGAMSPALRRYNRRMLIASVVYMVAMLGGANLSHALPERSPAMWAVALATIVPVFAMVWAWPAISPKRAANTCATARSRGRWWASH